MVKNEGLLFVPNWIFILMVSSNIIKEVSEQLLAEELKVVSPQQAHDQKLFGPVYHGTTSDKLEKIATQGFNVFVGHERSGDISQGYEASDYFGGIPAPIHHLGFGVYFTTVKAIAQGFGYGNTQLGPYFLNAPNITTINFGSPRTMMKWWLENGYDYKKTPETTFGSGETSLSMIRQERLRATLHMTEFLKAQYDGVWFKGKGIRRLLDGDQVVIFNPDRIYKLDKKLAQQGEIGSRVVSKVGIDPYGRGEIKIPMGTKGVIVDKKKPTEFQKWADGSEWIYHIKWDKGGHLYDVLDSWIEPYVKKSIKNISEAGENVPNLYPINKQEEEEVLHHILRIRAKLFGPKFVKTIKKVKHKKDHFAGTTKYDIIVYEGDVGNGDIISFGIRKTEKGTGFTMFDKTRRKKYDWKLVIPSKQPLTESQVFRRDFWKIYEKSYNESVKKWLHETEEKIPYYPISKMEESRAVKIIIGKLKNTYGIDLSKTIKKIGDKRSLGDTGYGEDSKRFAFNVDILTYKGENNKDEIIIWIKSTNRGLIYHAWSKSRGSKFDCGWDFVNEKYTTQKINTLTENDEDHGQALQQTGYWGKQGAGAIILAQNTGRILLPYRSSNVEQPHTWGVWGGAIDEDEEPAEAVRREISEEVGYPELDMELIPMYVYRDPKVGFQYSNFLVVVPKEFTPKLNWETENSRWVTFGEWPTPLHFGLKALLQNSGDDIFKEIQKRTIKKPESKTLKPIDKARYNAAVDIIRRTWGDMARSGDYKNRFDYDNSFVHWMQNSESIQNLVEKYGHQFYADAHEPGYEFQNDVENVLEMLETKLNQRRASKINKDDPLFFLKQSVQGKTWNGAKQALSYLSWSGRGYKGGKITDDLAEGIFNKLYRISLGETFYEKDMYRGAIYLDQYVLSAESSPEMKNFIQYYNGRNADRFPNNVKVYRGLHSPAAQIRPGDHTSFDKGFVRGYEAGKLGTVISATLPSKDLLVTRPDPNHSELIYWPPGHQIKKVENVPTFRQFYNQWAFP